mgnify:CR=1 FL=1
MSNQPPPSQPAQTPPVNLASDKLWNVLCHLSAFLGVGLILPLIVYLVTKDDHQSTIPDHAREALNFHLSLFLYSLVSLALCLVLVGFLLLPIIAIAGLVLAIVAAVKASNNEFYRYPLTIRLVR